jgi:hypothetical protein
VSTWLPDRLVIRTARRSQTAARVLFGAMTAEGRAPHLPRGGHMLLSHLDRIIAGVTTHAR